MSSDLVGPVGVIEMGRRLPQRITLVGSGSQAGFLGHLTMQKRGQIFPRFDLCSAATVITSPRA